MGTNPCVCAGAAWVKKKSGAGLRDISVFSAQKNASPIRYIFSHCFFVFFSKKKQHLDAHPWQPFGLFHSRALASGLLGCETSNGER